MQHVVVINDFKNDSLYKTLIEGMLLNLNPSFNITYIDTVNLHRIYEAALILRFAVFQFPKNSIFLFGVSSVCPEDEGYLYVSLFDKHIFLPNNGILGLFSDIIDEQHVYRLPYLKTTFPEIEIFIPAIAVLLEQASLNEYVLKDKPAIKKLTNILPHIQKNQIIGTIIYIDVYGNAITNITQQEFENHTKNKSFIIYPGTRFIKIYRISESYDEVDNQEVFALFNLFGFLELGIKNSSLSSSYNLTYLSNITIELYDT